MDTWVIVLIVIAVVVVLALIALTMASAPAWPQARKREQAREHLQEAQVRTAKADQEQALAEEQAARARREKAEAEERAAVAEREARERVAQAHDERSTGRGAPGQGGEARPRPRDGRRTARVDQVRTEQRTADRAGPRPTSRLPPRRGRGWRHPPMSSGARAGLPSRGAARAAHGRCAETVILSALRTTVAPSIRRTPEGRHDRPARHRHAQGAVARAQ